MGLDYCWVVWYPIVLQLHRLMVAISGFRLTMMGGAVLLLILLFRIIRGSRAKQREVHVRVIVELAMLPGPPGFLGRRGGERGEGVLGSGS